MRAHGQTSQKPMAWSIVKKLKKAFFGASAWPSIGIYWFLIIGVGWMHWAAAFSALLYAGGYIMAAQRAKRVTQLDVGVLLFWLGGLGVAGLAPAFAPIYLEKYFSSFPTFSFFSWHVYRFC